MVSISVFGIGKLGLPFAAILANKGFLVIGVDVNQDAIRAINKSTSSYYEPGLEELLRRSQGRLKATDDYEYAVNNSEVSFIFVPTPSVSDGNFSTKYVEIVAERIARLLKDKRTFHLIVLSSTVIPGSTDGVIKPILEEVSGKKCGRDFGLCYSPEFVALGNVIVGFTNPDVMLIGESDKKSGKILMKIFDMQCENNPPIVRTNIYNAELAKIALNAYITLKISFANTLAEMAEKIPGGNVDEVTKMLGLDSRIGKKYLRGGLAYGGPCFPRDNKAFVAFARKIGIKASLSLAADQRNDEQTSRIVHLVRERLGNFAGKKISILGLTYKPDTDIIEESAAIKIVQALLQEGANLSVYDPAALDNTRKVFDEKVRYASSPTDCIKDTEFCILATPWDEFKNLKPEDFINNMKKSVLLDCWRIYNRAQFSSALEYWAVGLSVI